MFKGSFYYENGGRAVKVQIIGMGKVGSQIAYTFLIGQKEVSDIIIYDIDQEKLDGQYKDLMRVKKITGTKINLTKTSKILEADVHIICVGRKRRYDGGVPEGDKYLFASNWGNVLKCFEEIRKGIVIIVTNPAKIIADSLLPFIGERDAKELGIYPAGEKCDNTKISGMEIQNLKGSSEYGIAIETYLMV